jgi:5-methylcytosine-specific restriction endonuclease McrA
MTEERVCAAEDCEITFVSDKWHTNQKYCSAKCSKHQYYKEHLEEWEAYTHKWQRENPEKVDDIKRKYRREHREQINAKARKHRQEHQEHYKAKDRKRRQNNPETISANNRKWEQKNPEKKLSYLHNYRARKRGNGGSYTMEELHDLWHKQNGFCFYCGELLYKTLNSVYHVEHKIPISRGGSNNISNIALSCEECNLRKGTRTHEEFLEELERMTRL